MSETVEENLEIHCISEIKHNKLSIQWILALLANFSNATLKFTQISTKYGKLDLRRMPSTTCHWHIKNHD